MAGSSPRPAGEITARGHLADPEPDDAALVLLARTDREAFGRLYDRYVGPIFRYCAVRTGDRETAEDTTSEVFLKALAAIGDFRGGVFLAWLFRIARNVMIDAQRRQRPSQPLEAAEELSDPGLTPEGFTIASAERIALRSAMEALPDNQRSVIEFQLAGWSTEQAAKALGKSPDAIKMLRLRALNRLRTTLARSGWTYKEARHG